MFDFIIYSKNDVPESAFVVEDYKVYILYFLEKRTGQTKVIFLIFMEWVT